MYQKHELVAQAFVHGESLQASLVGIIVPDEEQLIIWAKKNGNGDKSFKELCESSEVNAYILQALTKFGKLNDLKGFENVKKIYLCSELFSVQNDLFTPTFKLKRHQAKQRFQAQIDVMYAELQWKKKGWREAAQDRFMINNRKILLMVLYRLIWFDIEGVIFYVACL